MATKRADNIKLGAFVLAGTAVLLIGLYLLGNKRELFTNTIEVSVEFDEVSGLRAGNNVRYAGIDVGTVKQLTITSDTSVQVIMTLRESATEHIRSTALASIGSDGLMGNKLVILEAGDPGGGPLQDGTRLKAGRPFDTDAMLRTLSGSNDNLAVITRDLRLITGRLSGENSLMEILGDTMLPGEVRGTMEELRSAATNARLITERIGRVTRDLEEGKGALGALMSDPTAEAGVRSTFTDLQHVADSLELVVADLRQFTKGLNSSGGTVHALTQDTVMAGDIRRIIANLDTSSATLSEDLKALQQHALFRGYFKKKERESDH